MPAVTTLIPGVTTPLPAITVPAPAVTMSVLVVTLPVPAVTMPGPVVTGPVVTSPVPAVTVPAVTLPVPAVTMPAPVVAAPSYACEYHTSDLSHPLLCPRSRYQSPCLQFCHIPQEERETVVDWLEQFESVAVLGGWSGHCKLVHLTTRLRGAAYSRAYAGVNRGGPEAEKMGQSVLANQFIAGLRSDLKSKVVGVESSLEQLLLKARFEETKNRELRELSLRTLPPPQKKLPGSGSTPRTTPATQTTKNPPWRTPPANVETSRTCGITGHLAQACTYP